MNGLPLHAAFVHFPLGLAFVIPIVAAGIAVAQRRGRLPRAAFALVVGLQALLVASGAIAMELGDRDAQRVKRVVAERFIEAHEDRAEAFVWSAAAVLVVAIAAIALPVRFAGWLGAATLAGSIAVAGLAARTGEAGGEIVFRHGGAAAWVEPARPASDPEARSQSPHERD